MSKRKPIFTAIVACIAALLIECMLCNLHFWASLSHSPLYPSDIKTGPGIEATSESTFEIISKNDAYLLIEHIDAHIDSLFIDIKSDTMPIINIQLEITDSAHSGFFALPPTEIVSSVPGSEYIKLHLNGDSTSLKIDVLEPIGFQFSLADIAFNAPKPFSFSLFRFAILFALALVIMMFRPTSAIFKEKLCFGHAHTKIALSIVLLLEIILLFGVCQLIHPQASVGTPGWEANDQYNDYADALLSGSLSLDKEVPEFLAELDNPYDPTERDAALANPENDIAPGSYTDFAYYDGKFYSYFGILPALLFFAPYKAIFGSDLPTWSVVFLLGTIFCVACLWFLHLAVSKLLKQDISLGLFIALDAFVVLGSGFIYLEYLPVVYSVPIASGLCCAIGGTSCWIASKRDNGKVSPNPALLATGSALIALTLLCRPTFLLVFVFAIPLFWTELVHGRLFFAGTKTAIRNTLLAMAPFIIIGVATMALNAARFGSPFDFGANYNLTGNDMTHRGIDPARWPLGIYAYLLQPGTFTMDYPFMSVVEAVPDYQGHTSLEPMFGGFFFFDALALICFGAFSRKLKMAFPARLLCLISIALAFLILLIDIQASGITARYLADFGIFLLIPAALVIASIESRLKSDDVVFWFHLIVMLGIGLSILLNLWALLIEGRYSALQYARPTLFYGIKDSLSFLW